MGFNQFSHLYDNAPVDLNDDRNASTLSGFGTFVCHQNDFNKVLKDFYFPQRISDGKPTVYANKSDGITTLIVVANQNATIQGSVVEECEEGTCTY